jgi:hypothetical protein
MAKSRRCHVPFFGRTFLFSGTINRYRPVAVGRPRTTSFLVQVCTAPQCEQVNFCVFTVSVCQCFSSTVFPVSVSFEVEGQRTSRLLIPGRVFACLGGSKKNRVAILKSITNERSGDIVERHFYFHVVSNRYPNKSPAHSAGCMGDNEMVVGPETWPQAGPSYRPFQFHSFFRTHSVDVGSSLRPLERRS